MKIVFTAKSTGWGAMMDPRFGRAEYFLLYDEEKETLTPFDNSESAREAHGAGPKSAQKLFGLQPDVLITGNGPGGNAARVLEKAGINIYIGADSMTVVAALAAYKNGGLKAF